MGWIRNLTNGKKTILYTITIVVFGITAFLLGRGYSTPSDDNTTEIRRAIENLNEIGGAHSSALGILNEQYSRLEDSISRVEGITSRIEHVDSRLLDVERITDELASSEYGDRDFIIEYGILTDRNNRIINSLREESP